MMKFTAATLLLSMGALAQNVDYDRQLDNKPMVSSRQYMWSYAGGVNAVGSLAVAGAGKSVVLTPCPSGLAASVPVYISGGVGTAEAVAITAKSTAGKACTITFTTANTHSGSWRIGTATAGVKEAHVANPSAKSIGVPAGAFTLYAETVFVSDMNLVGQGDRATYLTLGSATMDAFSGTTWLAVDGFNVTSGGAWQTAGRVFRCEGCAIQVQNVSTTRVFTAVSGIAMNVNNCWFFNMVNAAIEKPSSTAYGLIRINNIYADGRYYNGGLPGVFSTVSVAGAVVTRSAGSVFTGLVANGMVKIAGVRYQILSVDSASQLTMTSAPTAGAGQAFSAYAELQSPALIVMSGTIAGATMSNLWMQAAQVHLSFASITGRPTNEIVVDTAIIDQDTDGGAGIVASNDSAVASGSSNSIRLNNIYFNGPGYGLLAQYIENVSLSNSFLNMNSSSPAIACNSCAYSTFQDNSIKQNVASAYAVTVSNAGTNFNSIRDNRINGIGGTLATAIFAGSVETTNLMVSGNEAYGVTNFLSSTALPANVVVRGNQHPQGQLGIIVTGANTLTLPVADESSLIVVNGGGTSGTVSTIAGGYNMRQVRMSLNASITFNTAGNIATGKVGTAGDYLLLQYDVSAAKWFIK